MAEELGYNASDDAAPKDAWANLGSFVCATCMFFVGKRSDEVGRCRRHAPEVQRGWPVVYDHDWCGDHKLGRR